MATDVEAIARRLLDLERHMRALSTSSQLDHSSIEGGHIDVYSVDGDFRGRVGTQPDGSIGVVAYNAPPPPTPRAPVLTSAPRGYLVTWDGFNDDGYNIHPLDWARVEIHSAVTTGFAYSATTLRGTFESPQGGSHLCLAGLEYQLGLSDTYEVLLVARNTSGTASLPSVRIPITVGKVETMDVADFALTVRKMQSLRHQLY